VSVWFWDRLGLDVPELGGEHEGFVEPPRAASRRASELRAEELTMDSNLQGSEPETC
jgi:hypothetical protein